MHSKSKLPSPLTGTLDSSLKAYNLVFLRMHFTMSELALYILVKEVVVTFHVHASYDGLAYQLSLTLNHTDNHRGILQNAKW